MTKKKKPADRASNPRPKRWRPPKPQLFDWSKFEPSMVLRGSGDGSLAKDLVTYRDHLTELLRDEGKFVLIVGGRSSGFTPSVTRP